MEAEKENQKGHILIRNVLNKYDYLEARDKAFIKRLAEGCMEERLQLDYLIGCYAITKNGKMKPVVRNILRMGIYQIIHMDSVPDSAACNESVNLAVQKGLSSLKGFINAVLRKVAREKEMLPWPKDDTYLSVYYSMPKWIVDLWSSNYGEQVCEKMLQGIRSKSETVIHMREDLSNGEAQELIQELEEAGIKLTSHPYLPYAYIISGAEGLERVPGFLDGLITVQDVSSMLAVELADIEKGAYVVDVCSAPGGKTVHAAIKVGRNGVVDARDLTEYKTAMIQDNAERMVLDQIKVKEWDARVIDEDVQGKADYVIADLPCSGLGVMGRKGDIRYHVSPESTKELQKLQREILQVVESYLKPGGILIYSTCTVNKEENEENREWILKNGNFEPVAFDHHLPEALKNDETVLKSAKEGYMQLLPGVHDCDGFFISYYKKR